MVLLSRTSNSRICRNTWGSEAVKTTTTRVRGRLHYTILRMAAEDKVVQIEEDLTKTRQYGLRNKTRSSPLFEE